jgi:hypothetical protein
MRRFPPSRCKKECRLQARVKKPRGASGEALEMLLAEFVGALGGPLVIGFMLRHDQLTWKPTA